MDRRARGTPPGAASSTEECPSTVPVFRWRGRSGAGSASGRAANVAGNDGGVVLGVNCDKGRLPNPHPGDRRTHADGTRVAPPGPGWSVTNPGNIPGPRTGTGRGRRLRLWSAPAPVWREIASPQQPPASPHFGTLREAVQRHIPAAPRP